jgi:putative FmdB family regulatory protein
MPTYEYICKKCGLEFELAQSISAAPLKICPKELCGRKQWGRGPVTKKISAGAGLLFRGNGFYITDYRSEGYKSAAKNESAGKESGGAEKSAVKPEAKPEAKPAAKPATGKTAGPKK